ncbi:DUF3298 domain-containing protein [Proteiniclasticum sp. SCR006]|uniref:DUF3298 domain-containing protein n=1 Tax=Proteiniclasticum aestuarii TaxID=2817862 RepID=A0A939H3I7_9CLOT|nr:DUF3298 domain-containing protein [Proteiniclasticum aestuarii]MBO1263469.1 DUF3298 domain-containing protein [Proteiniclasticum aestuarii]
MSESKKIHRKGSIERFIICLWMIVVLLVIVGCNSIEKEPAETSRITPALNKEGREDYVSPFREVSGPVHTTYLIANPPIEVLTEKIKSPEFREFTLSIKGLKDKTVEEKINQKIAEHHMSLKEIKLPPYRGIRRLIPEESTILNQDVSTQLIFSYNDIISVMTSVSRTYSTDASGLNTEYVDYRDSLTLDLHTGEEIRLSDLFLSDSDYLKTLNTLVSDYLSYQQATEEYGKEFQFITLTGPFIGLKEDQKFNLTENTLMLIFDCDTPEFDTRNYPVTISIPYKDLEDIFAIKERFYKEDSSIFENETPREHILISNFQERIEGENSIIPIEGIDVHKELRYPWNLSSSLKKKFIDFSEVNIEEIKDIAEGEHQQFYYQESTASSIGDYIIFSKMKNYHDGQFNFTQEYATFREDGTIAPLESLFRPFFDYEELIRKVLIGAIPRGVERSDEFVDQLLESLTFRLNRTDIYFASESIEINQNERTPVSFAIPYKIIGIENLTIFE